MNPQRQRIQTLTRRSLLFVLVFVQDILPFIGNIPIGPLSITTLPITIAVIAILFGPKEGFIYGTFWGLLTWVRAFVYPSSPLAPLIMTNPLISVVPRMLVGLVSGGVYHFLSSHLNGRVSAAISGALASLTNTILVLGGIYFFMNTPTVANGYHTTQAGLGKVLIGIAGTNGAAELIITALVVPMIAIPLIKHTKKLETTSQK